MQPIVTPEEMRAIDQEAAAPVEVLIRRAGWVLAREALVMLGGGYGKRVVVFAGKGNNGADAVAAAGFLERRGVRCEILAPGDVPRRLDDADLVIDGCVGTGLDRGFEAPMTGSVPVLAADIPSGIDGLTGEVLGSAVQADRTVCFAAWKPGLLQGAGPDHTGEVIVADIGLDCSRARANLVERADVLSAWPHRDRDAHKWDAAVLVVGGSPGMSGAIRLCAEATARAGAGYVAVATPGALADGHTESVALPLPAAEWFDSIEPTIGRFAAVVVGPGLQPSVETTRGLRHLVALDRPLVIDAGALDAVPDLATDLRARTTPAILTPHTGEFRRLTGSDVGADRIEAARRAAVELGSVVLLKGAPTVVAGPDGDVLVAATGDQRLATAGTGDVLSGMIGAALALGLPPHQAAAFAAEAHGTAAAATGRTAGLLASDLLGTIAWAVGGATLG